MHIVTSQRYVQQSIASTVISFMLKNHSDNMETKKLQHSIDILLTTQNLKSNSVSEQNHEQETQLKLAVADRTKPEVEIWRRPKKSTF